MSLIVPSYQSGFAPRDYEPAYPSLWQGCVAAYAPLLGPTGLVLRDSVGKNDGVMTNGPTWDISGGRYALGFDGVDDRVSTTLSSQLSSEHTIACWFKASTTSGVRILLEKYAGGATVESNIYLNSGVLTTYRDAFYTSQTVSANIWYHVALTSRGTTIQHFVNGVAQPSGTQGFYSSSASFVIGQRTGQNWNFNGLVDDVRVYNRTLSPNEIALLASRRGIGYYYKTHRSYSKTQSSGLLKRLILTGQT